MYRMTRESAPPPARATGSRSPFVRLRELLDGIPPGKPAISLAVGEPQHPIPDFRRTGDRRNHVAEFGRYPANKGSMNSPQPSAQWLDRRFTLDRPVDPATEVLVLNGTREGLFLAALAAKNWVKPRPGRPAVLIPNPFYAAYAAGAIAADCEPVYLPTTRETGFLPDLDALSDELLARTVAFYIASPSNPQGAVADRAYLSRLTALAHRFGFLVFSDECYCEIYSEQRAARDAGSGRAGFRQRCRLSLAVQAIEPAGTCALDLPPATASFMQAYLELRNVAAPMVPTPMQHVAIAAYNDETPRRGESPAVSREIRSRRSDHRRPLWLSASRRRIFPLARRRRAGRQRSSDARVVAGGRPARGSGPLSGAGAKGRQQSGRRLHTRRHGAEQRDHRRGVASSRRSAWLARDPEGRDRISESSCVK